MLNNPQWMQETLTLFDVDIDRKGRGALIASAALGRPSETPRTVWFAYDTADDGRTWSRPRVLPGKPQLPDGVFVQVV